MNPLDGPPVREQCPAEALAWSETRLERVETGAPVLALWLPLGVTAAIGVGQVPARELHLDAMRRDGVALVRRQSGGGAVLLHPGVLCWESLADVRDIERLGGNGTGIRPSYAALCRPILDALNLLGVAAFQAGVSDISVRAPGADDEIRKVAGTAQLRRRDKVLVHGSLLVSPDMALLEKYLGFPSAEPEYRRGRSHRDFCLGVGRIIGGEGDAMNRIAGTLCRVARASGWRVEEPAAPERDSVFDAACAKYADSGWNWEKRRIVG